MASGADIVLGSHVQAPPEEAPHRAGAYDEILAWLDWEFHKHDINKDGSLDYHEFMVRGCCVLGWVGEGWLDAGRWWLVV